MRSEKRTGRYRAVLAAAGDAGTGCSLDVDTRYGGKRGGLPSISSMQRLVHPGPRRDDYATRQPWEGLSVYLNFAAAAMLASTRCRHCRIG